MYENLLDSIDIEKRKEEFRIKLLKIRETDIDIYISVSYTHLTLPTTPYV